MQKRIKAIKRLIPGDIDRARAEAENLLKLLHDDHGDEDRMELYHLLGLIDFYSDKNAKAIVWYGKELKLREKLNDLKGAADILNNIGVIYYNQGKLDKALIYYTKALAHRESINEERGIAGVCDNIGAVLQRKGKTSEALDMHFRALHINQGLGDSSRTGVSLQNIGLAYYSQHEYDYALQNYEQALAIARETDDKVRAIQLLLNIGATLLKQKKMAEAGIYYKRCYKDSMTLKYHHGLIVSLNNLADIERNKGNYKKCIAHYTDAIAIARTTGHRAEIITALTGIGKSFGIMKDFEKSLKYLHDALVMAKKTAIKESISDVYLDLSDIYTKQHDSVRAFDFYKKHIALRDELLNLETSRNIHEIKTRYELEKKEKEMEINRLKNIELKNALDALTESKQQSDALLLNILPEGVAEELKTKGTVTAQYYEQVAVLFIDVKGFTKFCEHLSPRELVAEIDLYFSMFDSIIEGYPIEKIKTIGDAYLCAAGLPSPLPDCAAVAVRAALHMRDSLRHFNAARRAAGENFFDFRIGIHIGPLVAGVVGRKKFEYDIWGDTVNTAARMEQHGDAGQINISHDLYMEIKDRFLCTPRGKLEAKNKGLIDMYFVEQEISLS